MTNFVFQTDSDEVNEVFATNNNYLIKYTNNNENSSKKYCIIYFASNEIYYPNTKFSFENSIKKKDKYEWFNTRVRCGSKHIFVRDIKKQWYLAGINSKLNSIEKVLSLLKKETDGYTIITVGSSAGGFAAVLFGSMLNAEKIYSFNGQFVISGLLKTSSEIIDPIIFRERNNKDINKFFSIIPYINTPSSIYYFCSILSKVDHEQFLFASMMKIKIIQFNSKYHGIPFLKSSLEDVLNMSSSSLIRLTNRRQNPLLFSFHIEGYKALYSFLLVIYNKIQKEIKYKLNS